MDKKTLRRFPPCPIYDTEGMERWLSDMAKDGWLLEDQNALFGFFLFRKALPQTVHYRLEVVVNPQSFWDGDPKTPREEALALHEEFGWEFVLRHEEFYIYRSTQAVPRELHTDPEIQALTLKMLNRRLLKNLLSCILVAAFHVAFGVLAYPFAITMVMGTIFTIGLFLLTLSGLVKYISAIVCIYRQRQALLGGQMPNRRKDRRFGAKQYQVSRLIGQCLTVCFLLYLFVICAQRKNQDPLTEFTGTIPFITLEELASEGDAVRLEKIDNGYCQVWSDPLYPVICDFLAGGVASYDNGSSSGGLLEVQYCEAVSPWLAMGAAKDFTRFYSRGSSLNRSIGEVHPLPELSLDYAVGFYNQFGLIRVVLAEGNTAVCARFSMDDEGNFTIENWTKLMAEQLKQNENGR